MTDVVVAISPWLVGGRSKKAGGMERIGGSGKGSEASGRRTCNSCCCANCRIQSRGGTVEREERTQAKAKEGGEKEAEEDRTAHR